MTLSQDKFIGVGTNLKYYIDQGGEFIDITPLRLTAGAGDATFSASNGDATVTVTETAHGAVKSDFVTFSAAVSLGGNITAARLNQEYQIATIVDDNNFTIEAREVADLGAITVDGQYTPTPVLASAGDTGNGGTLTVAAYQVNVGLDTTVFGNGWGAGTWGRGTWGSAANVNVLTETLRIWSHDNFGQDLLINVRDGGVYYWDAAVGLGTRAVNIVDLAGSVSAPTIAKQVLVSDRDRHVIVFGCDTESNPGVQDPLAIRFSSQESLTDWATSADNTAGELRLGSGSEIVTAVETKQQILVYTDESLYAMQFLGPPFTFGINLISEKTSIMGPLAAVAVEDNVFWMGQQQFFAFAGTVQQIPCTVRDYVFDNFNYSQTEKVIASVNGQNSEVWWFYPSASSENVDKYVVYNYIEQVWYYGNLARTAWMDQGIYDDPIAASQDGYLYEHELGFDDGSTTPATAISAYIESSQVDIGDGDNFAFISRLVPDVTFLNSTASTPSATMTLKTRNFPGGNYLQTLGTPVEKTASAPVEQFTQKIDVRLRGRSFAFRMSSEDTGVSWRLGSPRLDIRPDGRR
tara:strand:- start:241 stop:1971 length:1731 start_codon:yes stop_codon:yes gene_type:complete